jgi:hypothetical protein
MPMRGRRVTLREVKANANKAAVDAQRLIAQSSGTVNRLETETLKVLTSGLETLAAAVELIDDIQDGVTLTVVREGDNSIMDFVMGRCDELPIGIKVRIQDVEE